MSEHVCPSCNSERLKSKGIRTSHSKKQRRYKCKDCNTHFQVDIEDFKEKDFSVKLIEPTIDFDENYDGFNGIVVTSALNDTPTNEKFLKSLFKYCKEKSFKLFVIPIKYLNPSAMNMDKSATWSPLVQDYLLRQTVKWKNKFKIIGDCNIQATATHPLTSIDGLCEGITTIVGHPVVQMKTLPVNDWHNPVILHSTGCVSEKTFYSSTKAGYRASFHHCFGAVAIEFDNDRFHLRQLFGDKTGGFADLDEYWTDKGSKKIEIDALICGDEHVIFGDDKAYNGTFFNEDSIVNVLKPKYIVRHDVLDCHSVSKWHDNDFLTRYRKNVGTKTTSVEEELNKTISHLEKSTPEFATSLIVSSNHHDHLDQWLNNGSVKHDYINAEIYHFLMWRKLLAIKNGEEERNAFQIYLEDMYSADPDKVRFMKDGFSLHGILLSEHGAHGPSGAKGSIQNLSRLGEKIVHGHCHSPGIMAGAMAVGTLSKIDLDYTSGATGWIHTNCIIHKNGKRQLVNVIGGKWRKCHK